MKTKLLLLLISSLFWGNISAQNLQKELEKPFSPSLLKEDLGILKRNLENVHTALYTYYPKSKLDSVFSSIDASLTKPMTSMDFYRKLTPMLKIIANGHTDIRPPSIYYSVRQKEHLLFPFGVYWEKEQLYITRNVSYDETIEIGQVIHSINGVLSKEVFTYLQDQQTRDGYNQTSPILNTQRGFSGNYADHFGNPENFELILSEGNGEKHTVQVKAVTVDSMNKFLVARYGPRKKRWYQDGTDAYTLEIEGKTAIMTLRTFGKSWIKKNGPSYKKFFNESFKQIEEAQIEHLIIDMRDNGGGDPQPTIKLFAHLHDKPFTFYKSLQTNTKKIKDKKYYTDNIFFLNLLLGMKVKKQGDKYYVNGVAGLKESKPAKPYYSNKTYILTNPNSFSATGEMTAILKEWNKGIFIGEEAGGNPNQNTSGVMLQLILPHTKLQITNPAVLFEMNVSFENTGHGVIPDHIVRPSLKDYLEDRDVVMEFTKELIRKQ